LAVGGIVLRTNEILLVKRAKDPGRGLWSIPGGRVKLGERLEDAVRREVFEETGLRIQAVRPVKVIERIYPRKDRIRFHYVIIDYICTPNSGDLRAGSDAEEARWVPWNEVPKMGLTRQTLSVLEEARGVFQAWQSGRGGLKGK
jgi:mutator protein MutT